MATERERLEEELAKTKAELSQVEEKLKHKADYGLGTGGATIYEWEFQLALRESLQQKARSIEAALQKLDGGAYGVCERCHRPISPERLAVLPHTTLCIDCARRRS
ncbi:MAG: TraR/DksA family transcriptional regulator [Chloroflexota bacterium]